MATTKYTVQKGDTLWGIATKYPDDIAGQGTTAKVNTLVKLNNIVNPNYIVVGQVLYFSKQQSGTSSSKKPTIQVLGVQSNSNNTLYVTWKWTKENTKEFKVVWEYATGDGIYFEGSTNTVAYSSSKNATYNPPDNATKVRVRVTAIANEKSSGKKYWSDKKSDAKTFNMSDLPPEIPPAPSGVTIDENYLLKVEYNNVDLNAGGLEFEVVKDNSKTVKTARVKIVKAAVTFTYTVEPGGVYKVRCRSYQGDMESNWSDYSDNVSTRPTRPASITTLIAESETSVRIEWSAVANATGYTVQYRDASLGDFSISTTGDQTASPEGNATNLLITGLESGKQYIFRVKATNAAGDSPWSTDVKSVTVGKAPGQPTTWSSATSAVAGESVTLYWMHNSEDGSKQTSAVVRLTIKVGEETQKIIELTHDTKYNGNNIDLITHLKEGEAGSLVITDNEDICMTEGQPVVILQEYTEGVTITWSVKTAGVFADSNGKKVFSEYSTEREITIYAKPTLDVKMVDKNGEHAGEWTLTSFPFTIKGIAESKDKHTPVSYDVEIRSTSSYETVNDIGDIIIVNRGDSVYSKNVDTDTDLSLVISAGDIDLENGVIYEIVCSVHMNSGLSATADTTSVKVVWDDYTYEPDMEVIIDEETYSATLRPYCYQSNQLYYKVIYDETTGAYTKTDEVINPVDGVSVDGAYLSTGEIVFTSDEDDTMLFAIIERAEGTLVDNVTLSIYRRDFDGKFTEIATGLPNDEHTYVVDPHPSLDYARYRVVAKSTQTGTIGYTDIPSTTVGGSALILQWNDTWTSYSSTFEDTPSDLKLSTSMLKLPYNVDVSSSYGRDVAHIEYIGREHPVSYFGTQLGESCNLSADVDATDKETLYALRRLATWMGNVYVRTPNGIGYWATVEVSFNENHMELVVPVSIAVTRVEGGI